MVVIVLIADSMRAGSVSASGGTCVVPAIRTEPVRSAPLEGFFTSDVSVQFLEACPVDSERSGLDPCDQFAPRARLVEHLLCILDTSSAYRDPVHEGLDLGEGERVAFESHCVEHDLLEDLARSEDCA